MKVHLIHNIGLFVSRILKIFGLVYRTEYLDSLVLDNSEESNEGSIAPFLDTISQFRDEIRAAAQEKDFNKIFSACDKLRQVTLPQLGVKLEDRPNLPTIWKLFDKNELLAETEKEKVQKVEATKSGKGTNPNAKVNNHVK